MEPPVDYPAALADDMQNLVTQANNLDLQLKSISLNGDSVCAPLVAANQAARDLVNSITAVNASLAAPLSVDSAVLDSFDQLFYTGTSIANEALRLSVDINTLSQVAQALTIKDGITAMLQLSDDISTMADRIGEMSDKILVMADNIGLMADRILVTQQIQSQNVALTQASILQTQTNMLTLLSVAETASYDLDLNTLVVNGELLAARMAAVVLNPLNMARELGKVADDVKSFLDQVRAAEAIINQDAAASTMTINTTTLTSLANLSIMLTSLATAVDGYVVAIEALKNITADPTLASSMQSMLELSADIGTMADSILEMGDVILAMADNIGLMADQILVSQQLQSVNVATTQASILAAQELAIGIIAANGL